MLSFGLLVLVPSAQAQCDEKDPSIPPIDCRDPNTAVIHINVRNDEQAGPPPGSLSEARQRFWSTYPDLPNHEQARKDFAEQLFQRDLWVMYLCSYADDFLHQKYNFRDTADLINSLALKDSIPDSAMPAFVDFVNAYRESLKVNGGLLVHYGPQNATEAKLMEHEITASRHKYFQYVWRRDWAEFDAAGKIPAIYTREPYFDYAALIYARFGPMPIDEAKKNVRAMRSLYNDDDLISSAARDVMRAPKTRNGNLVNHAPDVPAIRDQHGAKMPDLSVPQPPEVIDIYSSQLEAFELICARASDKGYAMKLLADAKPHGNAVSRQIGKWDFAKEAFDHFKDAYGEAAVLQAAHAVRTATKQLYDGEVMHPETIGAVRHGPYYAFQDILAKKDPAGAVRLILAFDPGAKSRAELNATYAKLVAQYTEPKIFAAMQDLATKNTSPEYGEYKHLLRELGAGGAACDPDPGIARGGKAETIGGKAGTTWGSGCAKESGNSPIAVREDVQPQPYVPNPELPNYELTESSAAGRILTYCTGIYNPAQPLLTQQEIKKFYANQGAVDADVKRCVSWFDVKRTMMDRKQAMRYCVVNYDFLNRRSGVFRQQYDACMNEHDTVTALCTLEFRNRNELNRKKGFESDSKDNVCPGDAPGDSREYYVVKFGGSEDLGHFKVPKSGPELPAVLKASFPAGVLHTELPVQGIGTTSSNAGPQTPQVQPAASTLDSGHVNGQVQSGGAVQPVGAATATAADPPSKAKAARSRFNLPFAVPNLPRVPGRQGGVPTNTAVPASAGLTNRFVADANRAQNARMALQRMQQSQGASAAFPDDVVAARARLDTELRTAASAMTQNPNVAEPAFVQLEQTVAVLERFLAGKPRP